MSEFVDIQKLVELFNPKVDDSESEDERDEPKNTTKAIKPENSASDIPSSGKKVNPYAKIKHNKEERREILDPENEELLYEELEHGTQSNWKDSPKWDIAYKQQVTASDVFLQMGFKNPTSSSCEDMIISIHLPGESHQNIDLKILKDSLTLVSPRFYLQLPLPHPVDPQKGNAKWDSESQKLIVTLRMDRELDLVNF
ncbi:hypothetical protein JTB14_019460 [Gonioctena quinquepunctata]|nr:hypothetical protein JTB14_019460 [Gonioctena quinquepunctata]